MRIGIPRIITTDNSKEFKKNLDDKLSRQLRIKCIYTAPYHPQIFLKTYSFGQSFILFFTDKWT